MADDDLRRVPLRPSYLVDWDDAARRYSELVMSIPLRRGLDRNKAEEVFQNTWMVALSKAEVPEEEAMAPWLELIAIIKTRELRGR